MAENRHLRGSTPKHLSNDIRDLVAGDPYGTRTRVFAVRGRRPGPLDEGAVCGRWRAYVGFGGSCQSGPQAGGRLAGEPFLDDSGDPFAGPPVAIRQGWPGRGP